ncbi:hypothetical protein [Mongoliitalea lutea]|uniref:hypothetical protein n=1 Tax=Mongoliitalea lutea TaxID=849756 RepID=UPI0016739780|nr:hypothetical protein [Mongoliitalea lutea]
MAKKYVPIAYTVIFILLGLTLAAKFIGGITVPPSFSAILLITASVLLFWNALLKRKKQHSKNRTTN